jgi:5-methylcytosine-specific restriction protein A
MTFDPGLKAGETIGNDRLCEIFKCSPQGGMRRSLRTNTLVVVSNHVRSIYHDRWVGDIFHYTGMGTKGDQSRSQGQNKTLDQSASNGVSVHLFEVDREGEYIYQGPVRLADEPYQEEQPDEFAPIGVGALSRSAKSGQSLHVAAISLQIGHQHQAQSELVGLSSSNRENVVM